MIQQFRCKTYSNFAGVAASFWHIQTFNETNIDLISRYRRVGEANAPSETGWNIFSTQTIVTIAPNAANNCQINFIDFEMPFDIPRSADPMRNGTVNINGRSICTNGAGLQLREKLTEIHK